MRLPASLLALALVGGAMIVAARVAAREPYDVTCELNVAMKTRDGVTLNADIYRPKGDGKFPVILRRTPYGKASSGPEGINTAARGYVYIAQDVRGRESSGGEWYPFKHEAEDGYDTVEWAAALPYANGKVGMISGSYEGITQLFAAMAAPPHLVCTYTGVCPADMYAELVYNGGAFMQALTQAWAGALSVNEFNRRVAPAAGADYWARHEALADYPQIKVPEAREVAKYYQDWLKHPAYDDYWKAFSFAQHYDKITVPVMHWGGWYDLFAVGTLKNYAGIRDHGGSEAARKGQRLVMVPGGHAGFTRKINDVDFGENSVFQLWPHAMRWFDWHLKGIDDGISKEKPVHLFIMGENVWRDEDDWPLARAVTTRYFLHSGGHANTAKGDGRLGPDQPADEPADRYVYDPANPVPTIGGSTLGMASPAAGPSDQRSLEGRADILSYVTPAFEKSTEVTGPISLDAYFSTSVEDTDLIGRVIDVYPDGRAIILSEGVLRLRYRDSFEKPELMKPGQVYHVNVDLWATANVFLPGHKLRLEITSSSYPRFDRHPNHGGDLSGVVHPVAATSLIHHDHDHPTALVLPIVPR